MNTEKKLICPDIYSPLQKNNFPDTEQNQCRSGHLLLNVYENEETFNTIDQNEMNKGNRYDNKKGLKSIYTGSIQIWNCRYPNCKAQYKAIYLHTSMGIEWYGKGQHTNHLLTELIGDGKRRKFPDKVYNFNVGKRSNCERDT